MSKNTVEVQESQSSDPYSPTSISLEVLSIKQAAEFLSLSTSTLYTYVNLRKIPFSKRNGKLYFLKSSLLKWIKESEKPTLTTLTSFQS